MPIIEFKDATGIRWRVWSTVPRFATGVAGTMLQGWLTFESGEDRRRLAPIPDGWETATIAQLREFCVRAQPIGRTPNTGSWRIEPRETQG